jgi:hypothetical protein
MPIIYYGCTDALYFQMNVEQQAMIVTLQPVQKEYYLKKNPPIEIGGNN